MKAIIYCRTNRESGSRDRFLAQMEETAGFCGSRGYGIVETVREICAGSMTGPLLKKAVADCREGRADAIVVRDISRIGRNYSEAAAVMKEMESFGGMFLETRGVEKSMVRVKFL